MMPRRNTLVLLAVIVLALVFAAGCAPGNERWASVDNKAGFWAGLWHGLIIIVTFVVSLFTRDVGIYEANNAGWGYNIGFLLGCMISLGGGARAGTRHKRRVKITAPDPDRVARRVERGVRDGLRRAFADRAESFSDSEWETLGHRIEERVREELRDIEKGD